MKRRNGEGSWGKKKIHNTLYYYYRDADGHYTYARTQKLLRQKLEEQEFRNGLAKSSYDVHTDSTITVGEYVKKYIESNRTTLQPYTYYNYTHMVDNLLIRNHKLSHRQMTSVTPDLITDYFASLGDKYSYGTVISIYKIIKPALNMAEEDGLLRPNTVRKIKLPKKRYCQDGRDICVPTPQEMKQIEDICFEKNKHGKYKMGNNGLVFIVIMHTGLRIGEAVALRWTDIDFDKRSINVNKSASFRVVNDVSVYEEKEPKSSSSYRVIPFDQTVYEILSYLKENYPNDIPQNENHVFLNSNNTHMAKSTLEQSLKRRIAKRLDMPGLTPHSLRHAYSSYLASQRVNPKVIAKLMGHSKIDITFNVYVDGYEAEMVEASNLLNKIGSDY